MSNKEIITLIERKREELIETAMESGFTSNAAICQSQELDNLLNEYYRYCLLKAVPSRNENSETAGQV